MVADKVGNKMSSSPLRLEDAIVQLVGNAGSLYRMKPL